MIERRACYLCSRAAAEAPPELRWHVAVGAGVPLCLDHRNELTEDARARDAK